MVEEVQKIPSKKDNILSCDFFFFFEYVQWNSFK